MSVNDYRIVVPPMNYTDTSDSTNVDAPDDAEVRTRRNIRETVRLLEGIDGATLTPARLGWMALWSRTLELLRASCCLGSGESIHLVWTVMRLVDEHCANVQAVLDAPSFESAIERGRTGGFRIRVSPSALAANTLEHRASVRERMEAYCAVAVWFDAQTLRATGPNAEWNDIYTNKNASAIASDPEHRASYEARYGEIEFHSEGELERDRISAESTHAKQLNRNQDFQNNPRMALWIAKLNVMNATRPPNFLQLINTFRPRASSTIQRMGHRAFMAYLCSKQ